MATVDTETVSSSPSREGTSGVPTYKVGTVSRRVEHELTSGITGTVAAAGGDWGNYNADGTIFFPDAKIVLQTDDGVNILMSGRGRSPYFGVEFETGSQKYAWLNPLMCIARIAVGFQNYTAEIFQVRQSSHSRLKLY